MINNFNCGLLFISLILFSFCTKEDCPDGINLIPMFGNQKKCDGQLKTDRAFIAICDSEFHNRGMAAKHFVDKGWEFYNKADYLTSMKRFNQAWLLDSLNADIYWGFGNLLGVKHDFKGSLPLLERSIKLNPLNPRVYECIANSYGQLYSANNKADDLYKAIDYLKIEIRLNNKSSIAYAQLTAAYCYFIQKDSARKYLKLTDNLDIKAINPDVRKILTIK